MKYHTKEKLKKILLRSFLSLFLIALIAFVSIIVYTVSLELKWDRFSMSLAEAVYLSNDQELSLVRADYNGNSIRVCTQNAKNLFNFITNAKAGGFSKPKTVLSELTVTFGDGSVLHLFETKDNGVYLLFERGEEEFSFSLGTQARFDKFVLITSLESRVEGNLPWEEVPSKPD